MYKTTFLVAVWLLGCASSPPTEPDPRVTASETHETPQEESSMMVIRVLMEVSPDNREAFASYLSEEANAVRALPGCLRYELFRDPVSDTRFLLYEEWATEADFRRFQQSDRLRESFQVLGPMMAGPPDSAYFAAAPSD